MDRKKELIEKIVLAEWEMFQNVRNIGGLKASCQESPETFEIMRASQFVSWAENVLESYLDDLENAKSEGRNLLTEKYARMMESTSPLEYDRLKNQLSPLDPEIPPLIEKIMKIILVWEEALSAEFPNITKKGRPIFSSEDNQFVTSKETYFKGELASYSKKTLDLFYENLLTQKADNINPSKMVLEAQVTRYGYPSLEKADEVLKTPNK